jgi:hypothetical protein
VFEAAVISLLDLLNSILFLAYKVKSKSKAIPVTGRGGL